LVGGDFNILRFFLIRIGIFTLTDIMTPSML
jgi:hypothetical protein